MVVTPRAKPVGPLASRAPTPPPSGVVRALRFDGDDRRVRRKWRERSLTAISPEVQSSREKGAARKGCVAVTFQNVYQAHFRLVWRALRTESTLGGVRRELTSTTESSLPSDTGSSAP